MHIAYILDVFPAISLTFVMNEIDELDRLGARISIFSLNRPDSDVAHEVARKWAVKTQYRELRELPRLDRLVSQSRYLMRYPADFLSALRWARTHDDHLRWSFRGVGALASEVRQLGVTHIHAHFAYSAAEYAWCVSRLTRVPFSITTHRYDILDTPHRYYPELSEDASFVRSISLYNAVRLTELGVGREKIPVIHCGVRPEEFDIGAVPKVFDVLSVGSLIDRKGHHYLVEAARRLKRRFEQLRVCIVGEGPNRQFLQEMIKRYDLQENVTLVGAQPQEVVRRLLAETRVFALPSISEGIAVSAMEAQAVGLPVVCSDVEGMHELVENGVTGVLVPPGDATALAESLSTLLDDQELCSRLGTSGRRKVIKDFNLHSEVAKLHALFQNSVKAAPSRL